LINETRLIKLLKKTIDVVYQKHGNQHVVGNVHAIFYLPSLSDRLKKKLHELGIDTNSDEPQIANGGKARPAPADLMQSVERKTEDTVTLTPTQLAFHTKNGLAVILTKPDGDLIAVNIDLLGPVTDNKTPWQPQVELVVEEGKDNPIVYPTDKYWDIGAIFPIATHVDGWRETLRSKLSV